MEGGCTRVISAQERTSEEGRRGIVSCRVREERTGGAENGSQHKGVRKSQAGSFSIEEKGVPEARGGGGSRDDTESR